jgi:hypothetical protein
MSAITALQPRITVRPGAKQTSEVIPTWAREAAAAVGKALGPGASQIDWSKTSFSRGHAESIDIQLGLRDGSRRSLVVTDQFSDQLQVMTPRAYQSRVGF